jgi:hypothetical protein
MRYARKSRALLGQHGYTLLVQFDDDAVCETKFADSTVLSDWIKNRVRFGRGKFYQASGVASFKVVVLDESRHWAPEIVKKAGGRIFATYLFDSSIGTHLCELTPSYYLIHLFSTPLQDTEDGAVENEIRDAEALCDNNAYFHCHAIDSILPDILVKDFGFDLVDDDNDIGVSRADLEEGYTEWCLGNCGGLQFPPTKS